MLGRAVCHCENSGTDALKRSCRWRLRAPTLRRSSTPAPATRTVPGSGGTFVIPVQFCPVDIGAMSAALEIGDRL